MLRRLLDGKSGELNPLDQMPNLAQERTPGQSMDLPLEREMSSIPTQAIRRNGNTHQPQQFYTR